MFKIEKVNQLFPGFKYNNVVLLPRFLSLITTLGLVFCTKLRAIIYQLGSEKDIDENKKKIQSFTVFLCKILVILMQN
jgi:hypothetical protein